ncbi:uncharacterized protein N7483_005508 [Penicillium malachiteum]|uniref:uncharacterized protein n=1 Tax=Penicillium malachiteum TaxID=1324776 RepID=UPI0025495F35|nr:uncharacterized protein N7483_005508 [Penicillium malachiteum]KAJ5731000.1 hypothetical protein N7483_005508 [Penicillium malachiteum]
MRYENWDILLFPEGSKVPIQEFKTQCYVTKDTESPYLQVPDILSPQQYFRVQGNVGQVPVLTSFVPSMPKDSPFRVSIHSWEKPHPSRFIEKMMQPDDVLVFEARVLIDGHPVAGGVFGQRFSWPYVIDFSSRMQSPSGPCDRDECADKASDIDRDGNQDIIRFPAFHPEILEQRHWDAADPFGRIKVIIAEGFARPNRSPPFERVKDVICMSFQHAPLHILEYSNIAWPNASMWTRAVPMSTKFNAAGDFVAMKSDDTPHSHSPARPEPRLLPTASSQSSSSQGMLYNAWVANRAFPLPASQWQNQPNDPRRWGLYQDRYLGPFMTEQNIDTLINEEAWTHRGARSSREDVPMLDYSSSSGSRAFSSMTGVSYEHSKQPSLEAPMDDEQYNALIQALTPTKPPTMGTRAPSNTPSAVPQIPKPSAAAKARSKGYSRSSARTSVLRDVSNSNPSTREVSGSTNISNAVPVPDKIITPSKLGTSPSGNVKGKKEGAKENAKETPKRSPRGDLKKRVTPQKDQEKGNVSIHESGDTLQEEDDENDDENVTLTACLL